MEVEKLKKSVKLWKITTWVLVFTLIGLVVWSFRTGITPERVGQLIQNPTQASTLLERIKTDSQFGSTQQEVEQYINTQYVGKQPTSQELQTALLKGYVNSLGDKYSQYLTKSDYEEISGSINASFTGIGISFEYFGSYVEVQQVFDNTPAKEQGLKPGDRITAVDSVQVSTFGSSDIVRTKITGPEKTKVIVSLVTEGATKDITLERRKISFPIATLDKQGEIATIKVVSFGETLDSEISKIADTIRADTSIKKIILDLTNNTGGYLNGAVELVSYFTDTDQTVVIDKSKKSEEVLKTVEKKNTLKNYPLVITTNKYTASASEITTGALQDIRGTKTVGSKTFGKGVVQQIFTLKNGDAVKLTIAEWLTPKRRSINTVGISPDFYIEKDEVKSVIERFSWEESTLK
jgi:carboxyl-terminal processing protease